ncbi:Ger(x)C family spore germination protein [Paenibacillus allorhizosphaerae]|uniref:Spore germination protein B3 n=1 Tax=Paenibacillus allorhizosphaerae TaxID=2849866 RepID=A0ABM8VRZ0_9BACL|nr:Ger(x)C family spore germination protein [Paenibacillus allorhizosphaerae]CAG7655932.1 Spore germination protein B3 [Paenibacillus allorhizosphaerae]
MRRMIGTLLALVLLGAVTTGCWNRRELNDLAITVALGIDKIGNEFRVSAQLVNPSEIAARKGSTSKGAPVVTYSETGGTVFEALRKMTTQSPRKLYLSHLRMLVVSEPLAREGIAKLLDVLSRAHELRTDFFIVVARSASAKEMLDTYTVPQEIIPANHMFKTIDISSALWAASGKKTIDELISDMISKGKEPVLTGIGIFGDTDRDKTGTEENVRHIVPLSTLHIVGLAVFKNDKLIGWLNDEESQAYNYVLDKVKGTAGQLACPKGGKLTLEIIRTKSEIKGKLTDGQPAVDVKLRLENDVTDVECDIDLNDVETIAELERIAEKKVKQFIVHTIRKAQTKWHADIFGFGEAIHRAEPKAWKKIENRWDSVFAELPVNVNVDVKIRRLGTVSDPFMKLMKE